MPTRETFLAWAESLREASYYTVLRVPESASVQEIKSAFHAIALRCHPDRFVGEEDDVRDAASEVFKRAVEAYQVLSRADARRAYDGILSEGKIRIAEIVSEPPPQQVRTLEDIALTPRAKSHARKADLLLSIGKLDDARVALASAIQHDPDNPELQERLQAIYEAMALAPEEKK